MPLDKSALLSLGLQKSSAVQKSFWGGLNTGVKFGATGMVMVGFQAARAGRGGFAPAIIGQVGATAFSTVLTGFAAAGLSLIPGIGPVAAATLGAFIADYPELMLGNALSRKARWFTDLNKNIRHLEMGGRYIDTEVASRQRMIAIQDMNASMIHGRRYLGQEALLMHR